jgi:Zn-dependent membrane protease YugP
MFFDPIYLLFVAPGMLLSLWASWRVKSTFAHYHQVRSRSGMSGAEAARELLRRQNINDVQIEPVDGQLSDHYDPTTKTLRLSADVYHGRSLSALGVAAHEAGHAIQHAHSYGPLAFRSVVVRPAMIGSNLGMIVLGLGLMTHATGIVWVGVALFSAFVLFTLVTLPVEFNASSRAIAALVDTSIVSRSEAADTKRVLDAAALTYVAAAISAVLQLVYYLFRAGLLGGRNDD